MAALGADFYAFSGHKLGAPTGIGVLYGRREVLEPLEPFFGGSEIIREVWLDRATWNDLPWRFRAGHASHRRAPSASARPSTTSRAWGARRCAGTTWSSSRRRSLRLGEVEDLELYGPRDPEIRAGVFSFNFPGVHRADLSAALDAEGVAVRAGHHCAQPLMRRLGVAGTARASFFVHTGVDDIAALTAALQRARELLGAGRLRPSPS